MRYKSDAKDAYQVFDSNMMSRPFRRKALAQHFLVDQKIAHKIVEAADLSPQDTVVEIGPGDGVLTRGLVARARKVIALEVDPRLVDALPHRMHNPSNLTVVESDARNVDLAPLIDADTSFKVVANLPYYAANPIIRHFLEMIPKPLLMVVMVQREVALRMMASPGQMSMLSVAVQLYSVPRCICTVPPKAFAPPPKVTSTVLLLELLSKPAVDVDDISGFFTIVRAGFSSPRKQIRNTLMHGLSISKSEVDELSSLSGIDPHRRPATLNIQEWEKLYRAYSGS